jgi:hypothetical protein
MSAEDYESLQGTLYLFSTRANATHILRGLAEARDGRAEPIDPEKAGGWACWRGCTRRGRRLERRDHGLAGDHGGSRGRARV